MEYCVNNMAFYRKLLIRATNIIKRHSTTKVKRLIPEIDEVVNEKIINNELKHRHHPGIISRKTVMFPENLMDAIRKSLCDEPRKILLKDSKHFVNFLKARHPPPEDWELKTKKTKILNQLNVKTLNLSNKSISEIDKLTNRQEQKAQNLLMKRVYNWSAVNFDKQTSLQYLISRAAPEYTVIERLFVDIKSRASDFTPKYFFDFGSGVGTGIWALSKVWGFSMEEYFTVDVSPEMNDLARDIITNAYEPNIFPMNKLFQRQFLPSISRKYNLVLCAYSLFEMPSAKIRLETILNLWKKTDDFLVIVEHGTNAGYNLVCEARDFILDFKSGANVGHVFAPCPHDQPCPRFTTDVTPCNFKVNYYGLKFGDKTHMKEELFSYVILRKGNRPTQDPAWPRLVRAPMVKARHVICRMCCNNGKLEEVILTKRKNGAVAYRCAKVSRWGDTIPINLKERVEEIDSAEIKSDCPAKEIDSAEIKSECPVEELHEK